MGDALHRLASVGFQLGLAGATETDAADALSRQVGPHPGQTWQPVLQLSQLHLQAALVRLRPAGKDIEDEGRPVDDLDVEDLLQVALLVRVELFVEDDQVVVQLCPQVLDLLQLALAEIGSGQGVSEFLGHRADDLDSGRFGQAGEFLQRVAHSPGCARPIDGNQQGVLDRRLGRQRSTGRTLADDIVHVEAVVQINGIVECLGVGQFGFGCLIASVSARNRNTPICVRTPLSRSSRKPTDRPAIQIILGCDRRPSKL